MNKKKIRVSTFLKKNLRFKNKKSKISNEKNLFENYFFLVDVKYFLIIPNSNNNGHLFFLEKFIFFQSLSTNKKTPFGVFWNQGLLPSVWSLKDRWGWLDRKKRFDWGDIEISPCNLKITYRGLGRSDEDAASIRANKTIPDFLPFFYYEVKILNIGEFGYIGIGLCSPNVDLDRLPGWEKDSLGYHGDDGHAFRDSGTGVPYGPSFAAGDVIGVCFSPLNKKIFFSKNGKALPFIFCDVFGSERLPTSPMVGLRTPGETIEINFGKKPFEFDLNLYSQNLMYTLMEKVLSLGNFFEQKLTKNEPSDSNFIFSGGPSLNFSNFENRNSILREIIRKKYDLPNWDLVDIFCLEDSILSRHNFVINFLEKVVEIIIFYSEIIRIFHKIYTEKNLSECVSQKTSLNLPEIYLTSSSRKLLKKILKFKILQKNFMFQKEHFLIEYIEYGKKKKTFL